jgi:hypothetical protein
MVPGRDFAQMNYIQDRLTNNLTKVVNFYRLKMRPVASNHPLVRFLESLNVPLSIPKERWVDHANQQATSIGRLVGFGSAISPVRLLPGVFYGKGVQELVYVDTSKNYFSLLKELQQNNITTWRDIQSVNVLSHPNSDLSFHLVNNKAIPSSLGYATIVIDVAALIVQFQYWRKTQLTKTAGNAQSIAQFVGMYVIPNMLYSHIDVAWLNRLNYHLLGIAATPHRRLAAIALPSTMQYVDSTLDQIADAIQRKQFNFEHLWHTLPLPSKKDSYFKDRFRIGNWAPTRFTLGFKLATTLPWLELMFAIDAVYSTNLNRKYYVELALVLDQVDSAKVLDTIQGDVTFLHDRIKSSIAAYV